jgi:hypothetical protein
MMLGQAADEIFRRLPPDVQRDLQAVPAAAAGLANEAIALRARVVELSGEQRRLRNASVSDAAALNGIAADHDAAQQRLGVTIAALEAIRLDLLRLEFGQTMPGNLTELLDVVHDLQRRVDAAEELHRR